MKQNSARTDTGTGGMARLGEVQRQGMARCPPTSLPPLILVLFTTFQWGYSWAFTKVLSQTLASLLSLLPETRGKLFDAPMDARCCGQQFKHL